MPTLSDVRKQYPQYADMSDDALATALHQKFYSDMPEAEFRSRVGLGPRGPGAISEASDERAASNAGGAAAILRGAAKGVRDLAAGAVRGAGSIGATIIAPGDKLADVIAPRRDGVSRNAARRAAITSALGKLGANTDSASFGIGKIGAEVAGTAGAGTVIGNGLRAVPAVARSAPALIDAIETGGLSAAGRTGYGSIPARAIGGAILGGTQAGIVDPSQAPRGALVGAAMPAAVMGLGKAGQLAGQLVRGPAQDADTAAAIQAARQAGYVIPPTQARPTLANRALEGLSGKIQTAQVASARNQGVTNAGVAADLGLAPGTKIDEGAISGVLQRAGAEYDNLANAVGTFRPSPAYNRALDGIARQYVNAGRAFPNAKPSPVLDLVESLRTNQLDGRSAIDAVSTLREQADDAFRTGNSAVGRAAKAASKALEDEMEKALAAQGNVQALNQFKAARRLYAQAKTARDALNPETGNIDAGKLASRLKANKPLSGNMERAGRFAARYPKAAQKVEGIGSQPGVSPLDFATLGIGGKAGAIMAIRPAARGAILSPMVQNRLVAPAQTGGFPINALLQQTPFFAPVVLTDQ